MIGDKLYMGLEALITDEEDETKLEYYVQGPEEWMEYSYGLDGLDRFCLRMEKVQDLNLFLCFMRKKRMKGDLRMRDMLRVLQQDMMESFT